MARELTEKQLHSRLNKYYKEHFGELDTDEWHVNPAPNIWKFNRDGKTIILTYNVKTNSVTYEIKRLG